MSESASSVGTPEALIDFWFGDRPIVKLDDFLQHVPLWFWADEEQDAALRARWGATIDHVASGGWDARADEPRVRLAMIVALDQLPRNAYRGTSRAFAYDERALALSEDGIARGLDEALSTAQRIFFNLPRGHAESLRLQQVANAYVEALFEKDPAFASIVMPQARGHLATITRFGRFPQRNRALGRESTPEEVAFLEELAR